MRSHANEARAQTVDLYRNKIGAVALELLYHAAKACPRVPHFASSASRRS